MVGVWETAALKPDQSETTGKNSRLFMRIVLSIMAILIACLIGSFFWATSVPGQSYSGPVAAPDNPQLAARLEEHVSTLAEGPRSLQNAASITRATTYIEQQLASYGYAVERQPVITPADNLIIRIAANRTDAPILIVGAHYDTYSTTPGADDNASGVAGLLEIARTLKQRDGRSPVELVLVFYANEEPPYFKTNAMGSHVHAHSLADPSRIIGMISLESIGYYSDQVGSQNYPFPLSLRYPDTGNFIAFVGDLSSRDFLRETISGFRSNARIPSVGGTAPALVQGIDWSDHWG